MKDVENNANVATTKDVKRLKAEIATLKAKVKDAWCDAKATFQESSSRDGVKQGYLEACEDFFELGPAAFAKRAMEKQGYHPDIIRKKLALSMPWERAIVGSSKVLAKLNERSEVR